MRATSRRMVLGLGCVSTMGIIGRLGGAEAAGLLGQSNQHEIAELKLLLSLPVSGAATAIAWSADGSRLAAASNYGTDLTVWDVASGKEIENVPGPAPGQNPAFNVAYHFTLSPDQSRVAIAPARNDFAHVVIYDTLAWKLSQRMCGSGTLSATSVLGRAQVSRQISCQSRPRLMVVVSQSLTTRA
jgi:hypothetical protein